MKCSRCANEIELGDDLSRKVELTGEESSVMLCPLCKVCYICYTQTENEPERCKLCGYHCHSEHSAEIKEKKETKEHQKNNCKINTVEPTGEEHCIKCTELHSKTSFEALLGPEIPALERYSEDASKEMARRISEIVKKNSPRSKSTEGIKTVFLGEVEMSPLFSSPYPEEYAKYHTLHICHGCLDYFPTKYMLERHKIKCSSIYPPGRLLYLDAERVAVFEVEGEKEQKYCQSLCLLAKMFLDHKTLYYDVEPFLFYIIGEIKDGDFVMQGYFSKERGEGRNNLSCIVVFPPYRRLGLGSFLIDFSYYLTRKTTQPPYTAGPEQPLSADGERAYFTYWSNCILRYVIHKRHFVPSEGCFENISLQTGVCKDSIKWVYGELNKRHNKELTCCDFIKNRDIIRKIRRMKKGSSMDQSVESIDRKEEKEETNKQNI
ncbi:histone acetyltransferase MYST2 [Nematocida minor]|uniref:histone acetyltransferase MYST2 n=1 Tax=Nematocida minor TaxID=1912983 RepID=UPI00222029C4|nr:histone acetyltransferase MYST2 [Nematocida minor]KAI5193299.1 histone acetyltransferase MYST2 [Nematocida minor]